MKKLLMLVVMLVMGMTAFGQVKDRTYYLDRLNDYASNTIRILDDGIAGCLNLEEVNRLIQEQTNIYIHIMSDEEIHNFINENDIIEITKPILAKTFEWAAISTNRVFEEAGNRALEESRR